MSTSLFARIRRHWQRGTLWDALMARLGRMPERVQVKWHGATDHAQGVRFLAQHAQRVLHDAGDDSWVLCIGDGGSFQLRLERALRRRGLRHRCLGIDALDTSDDLPAPALIVSARPDTAGITAIARRLSHHPRLSTVPFEYAAGLDRESALFAAHDEYPTTFFVSPLLLDDPGPYAIYEESLALFEQKCGLRDFLDLYQLLTRLKVQGIEGCIAEFGSYRGHSGWLIARTLEAIGDHRPVYLFDTFQSFPAESLGLDSFWSATHEVDFDSVRAKLSRFEQVQLIRGDFTQTLAGTDTGPVALAYIDCDSYRATRYLIDEMLDHRLVDGGLLVCEDYGHPALLGNRVAVHECLDRRPGLFRFFSQFSGLFIAIKTPNGT